MTCETTKLPGHRTLAWLPLILLMATATYAQRAVQVGKGSYAEFPPAHEGDGPAEMVGKRKLFVDVPPGTPIPTNDWWTDLIINRFCGALWAHPLCVSADEQGLDIFFPTKWVKGGRDMVRDFPLEVHGVNFTPQDARARSWGDWTVNFRMAENAKRYMDVTLGHGLPFVWVEFVGVQPQIKLQGDARCFDAQGQPAALPTTTDHVGIELGGRHFGVFAPDGTTFTRENNALQIDFSGESAYLVFSPLPDKAWLPLFHAHAYAVPRDSRMTWSYNAETAEVITDWQLTTEALKGTNDRSIQGWIPHHYRGTKHELAFNAVEYRTPRGKMKCTTGNRFRIVYPFGGLLPHLPKPLGVAGKHDYDAARMKQYIAEYAGAAKYGADTYWGGKDLARAARYLAAAAETAHPDQETLRESLRASLIDWFTYSNGEKERYFARYPNWRGLVGFNESYWSYQFTDHHFHYGYFTTAAALLAMYDETFLADYGDMARLLAKEYANWDRDDDDFPFLRTFDVWEGHSWAGGFSSPGGNNQESTSEAVQSWGGLFLLGTMLDDQEMTATGAMGYAMETAATMEYWFDVHGDVLPEQYGHSIVGILFGGGQAYATYFSGDPAWIHGIQWLPVSPMLDYLGRDPTWARKEFRAMMAERKVKEEKTDVSSMGTALGNVVLGFALQFAPNDVATQMDKLWDAGDPVAREAYTGGLTYYSAHARRTLGQRQWKFHTSIPTSAVYHNDETDTYTYVVYNPRSVHRLATVFRDGKLVGQIHAPPGRVVASTKLLPPSDRFQVLLTEPSNGDQHVSRFAQRFVAIFSSPVTAESLAGASIEGKGVSGLKVAQGAGTPVAVLQFAGTPRVSETYTVRIPAATTSADGKQQLGKDYVATFAIEPQPPLAIVSSSPKADQPGVPLTLNEIAITFNGRMDTETLTNVAIEGPGTQRLQLVESAASGTVTFRLSGQLQRDANYTVVVPAIAREVGGMAVGSEQRITFTTEPAPLPDNVYGESFAGGGYSTEGGLAVDLRNTQSPREGRYGIKLQAGDKDGSVYFFNGTADHGDGRRPLDLSGYSHIEFWMKGTTKSAWIKIGHPVFDEKAFRQTQVRDISNEYRRYTLEIPEPKDRINTLLVVSVPAGGTLYLDNVRFVRAAGSSSPRE